MDATTQIDTFAPSKAERQKQWKMPKRGHFKQCHICRFNGRRDDEAQAACIACPGADDLSNAGCVKLSLDAINDKAGGFPPFGVIVVNDRPNQIPDNAKITIEAGTLAGILYTLADMRRDTLLVLHGLLKGFNFDGAAEYAGIKRQYGHRYAMEAVQKIPQFAALLPLLSRKRIREREIKAKSAAQSNAGTPAPALPIPAGV